MGMQTTVSIILSLAISSSLVHVTNGKASLSRRGIHIGSYKLSLSGGSVEQPPVILPENWVDYVDENSGQIYYSNIITGETTWDIPQVSEYSPQNYNVDQQDFVNENVRATEGNLLFYNCEI